MPVSPENLSVHVELGPRSYEIVIGSGNLASIAEPLILWLEKLPAAARKSRKAFIVTDRNIEATHAKTVCDSLSMEGWTCHVFAIDAGERSKSLASLNRMYDWLVEHEADRFSVLIAVGGGVIGDAAGFAPQLMHEGFRSFRCRRRCWPEWIVRSGARWRSITPRRRISSDRLSAAGCVDVDTSLPVISPRPRLSLRAWPRWSSMVSSSMRILRGTRSGSVGHQRAPPPRCYVEAIVAPQLSAEGRRRRKDERSAPACERCSTTDTLSRTRSKPCADTANCCTARLWPSA